MKPNQGATSTRRRFLFPSPQNSEKHVSKELASAWLQQVEKLAAVPKQEGGLRHPYRRKWVIEWKHWPDVDLAAAGGLDRPSDGRVNLSPGGPRDDVQGGFGAHQVKAGSITS